MTNLECGCSHRRADSARRLNVGRVLNLNDPPAGRGGDVEDALAVLGRQGHARQERRSRLQHVLPRREAGNTTHSVPEHS